MLRSRWTLWGGILLFPPVGLVLWWAHRGVRPVARTAGTLGICAVAIVELFAVYGMRLEWDGAMKVHGISFETRAKSDARVEASRSGKRAEAAPVVVPPPAAVAPAAVSCNRHTRRAGLLDRLPRSEPRGRVHGDRDRDSLAGGGIAPAMEAAGGRRLCILYGGRRPRVHHRAAARPRNHHGVRRPNRPGTLGFRLSGAVRRNSGRGGAARHAGVSRGTGLLVGRQGGFVLPLGQRPASPNGRRTSWRTMRRGISIGGWRGRH